MSDCDEHCMKVYDKNGNFQYKFGKKGGGDGEFNNPHCLSVNSGKLMVCDSGNKRIQIVELKGNFFGKFDTKSSKEGEFISPWSLAVLSNDQIVVSGISTNYVHIFELNPALSSL